MITGFGGRNVELSRSPNKEEWKKKIKNKKQRKAEFKSLSGVNIDVIYTPDDVSGDYLEKLGFPGEPPFTRGIIQTCIAGDSGR